MTHKPTPPRTAESTAKNTHKSMSETAANDEISEATNNDGRLLYLSDAWLAAANKAVADLEPLKSDLVVGVSVIGGPEGDRCYKMTLGTGPVTIGEGLSNTDITMTMKWPLAVAIATGKTSAQRSFLDGEIQLGGDANKLLGHQKQLTDIDDRLADVRDRTNFGS